MKSQIICLWFVLALPLTVSAQKSPPVEPAQFNGEFIYLRDYGSDDIAYLVVPQEQPKAGIVIVPDGHGVDAWTKITADAIAEKGYLVLALDLYNGGTTNDYREAAFKEGELVEKAVLTALKTTTVFYQQSPRFKMDKVFIVGIGSMSPYLITLATQKNLAVSGLVLINPARIPTAAGLDQVRYPMLFQLGGKSTAAVNTLTQFIRESRVPDLVEVKTAARLSPGVRRLDDAQWQQIAGFVRKNSTAERRKSLLERILD
ncbi:MAG: dienelactone hydrolase family protein [Verrucomicrobiales bacterium]|jgi:dienelactone hydrolase|nr:dienelactone hydrolase family protein [Verrucomicrobiales bacterium]